MYDNDLEYSDSAQKSRTLLIAVGIVIGIILTVIGAMTLGPAVAKMPMASPLAASLSSSGQDSWTHKELLDHLRSRGLRFQAEPRNSFSMYLFQPHSKQQGYPDEYIQAHGLGKGTVQVSKIMSEQTARDAAGVYGENAFAWKQFLFSGDPAFIREIRKAF